MKLVLAIDQATSLSGFALYKDGELINHGKTSFDGDTIERISYTKNWLSDLIDTVVFQYGEKPLIILEDIQYQPKYEKATSGAVASVTTFKALAQLQGTLLVMIYEKGLQCNIYSASEWKASAGIKGSGRVEQKKNAQEFVAREFKIKATQDECDAILLGYHEIKVEKSVINWG